MNHRPLDRPSAGGRICSHRRRTGPRGALHARCSLAQHMLMCGCLMTAMLASPTAVPGAPVGWGGMLVHHGDRLGSAFGVLRLRGGRKKLNADSRNPAPAELRRIKKKRTKRVEKRAKERAADSLSSTIRRGFVSALTHSRSSHQSSFHALIPILCLPLSLPTLSLPLSTHKHSHT